MAGAIGFAGRLSNLSRTRRSRTPRFAAIDHHRDIHTKTSLPSDHSIAAGTGFAAQHTFGEAGERAGDRLLVAAAVPGRGRGEYASVDANPSNAVVAAARECRTALAGRREVPGAGATDDEGA